MIDQKWKQNRKRVQIEKYTRKKRGKKWFKGTGIRTKTKKKKQRRRKENQEKDSSKNEGKGSPAINWGNKSVFQVRALRSREILREGARSGTKTSARKSI